LEVSCGDVNGCAVNLKSKALALTVGYLTDNSTLGTCLHKRGPFHQAVYVGITQRV